MNQHKAIALSEPYIIDRILPLIKRTPKSAKILDIATGQGYVLERLHELGFTNLYGADIDPTVFKLNKKTFHYKQVDANKKLPYRDAFFDIVISSETIEHLENPRHFIREVHRILKPKGRLMLTTPSVESIISRLYFLLTGRLAFHTTSDYDLSGHIAITPSWLIDRFCMDIGLKLKHRTYSCFYIPIVKIRITHPLFLNNLMGWITVSSYQKSNHI